MFSLNVFITSNKNISKLFRETFSKHLFCMFPDILREMLLKLFSLIFSNNVFQKPGKCFGKTFSMNVFITSQINVLKLVKQNIRLTFILHVSNIFNKTLIKPLINISKWCFPKASIMFRYSVFFNVWLNQGVGDLNTFLCCFKTRINDNCSQNWHCRLEESSRAVFYRAVKTSPNFSKYLEIVHVKRHRQALCRLLVSNHTLRIESGRWERPPLLRERLFCYHC